MQWVAVMFTHSPLLNSNFSAKNSCLMWGLVCQTSAPLSSLGLFFVLCLREHLFPITYPSPYLILTGFCCCLLLNDSELSIRKQRWRVFSHVLIKLWSEACVLWSWGCGLIYTPAFLPTVELDPVCISDALLQVGLLFFSPSCNEFSLEYPKDDSVKIKVVFICLFFSIGKIGKNHLGGGLCPSCGCCCSSLPWCTARGYILRRFLIFSVSSWGGFLKKETG